MGRYLVLDDTQATKVRGTTRTPEYALEPIAVPAGTWVLPEQILNDRNHQVGSFSATLQSLPIQVLDERTDFYTEASPPPVDKRISYEGKIAPYSTESSQQAVSQKV